MQEIGQLRTVVTHCVDNIGQPQVRIDLFVNARVSSGKRHRDRAELRFGITVCDTEEARTNSSICGTSSIAASKIAARIAGPLPAENTPALAGFAPNQSLMPARVVAFTTPAGKARVHHRSRLAKRRANRFTSPLASISN
jgi:hypothetical protein